MVLREPIHSRARTKTVATVGPASSDPARLAALFAAGVDVFRVNMAHGQRAEHDEIVDRIAAVSREAGRPLGILVDLAGPKIRLGQLFQEPLDCPLGGEFSFVRGDTAAAPDQLVCSYQSLVDELQVGDNIMLADGTVAMAVMSKEPDRLACRVVSAGTLRSRQGINLPGARLSLESLTPDDLDHAAWAARRKIDFVGLSFVRSEQDVLRLKNLLRAHGSQALVIAKIEKPEALARLEEIVTAADGVMVARGDLGVEIDVAQIAVAQKKIVATCNRLRKPVIVATQMLDSMQHGRRPTRAEATDVANAILDGADACMLSGETAIGEYPLESVEMMNRIMLATEQLLADRPPTAWVDSPLEHVHPITHAVVFGAARIADRLSARLVVIATRSGATALAKAKQRDFIPTIGLSDQEATLRRMCLFWGIVPVAGSPLGDRVELCRFVDQWGKEEGCLASGDRVVVITGTGLAKGAHNLVVVHEVE